MVTYVARACLNEKCNLKFTAWPWTAGHDWPWTDQWSCHCILLWPQTWAGSQARCTLWFFLFPNSYPCPSPPHSCVFAWGETAWKKIPVSKIAAVAAAKSLQSCPTLCDPIEGSPPGSPVPGILQARTLEWVATSFSNAWKWKVKVKSLSRVQLCRWVLEKP